MSEPGVTRRRARRVLAAIAILALAWVVVRCWPAPADRGLTRPQAVSRTRFAERDVVVNGLRLRMIDEGPRDAEVVLLLPGHTSRIEEYEALVPTLSARLRVIVFDFPGSGYSDRPDRRYTLGLYEETIVGVMDSLGIATAHLAGGSQGGNLAIATAARYPSRFKRLAAWSPASNWPAKPLAADAGEALFACYLTFWPVVKVQSTYWMRPDSPGREASLRATFAYYDEVMGPGFIRMYWGIAFDTVRRSLWDVAARVPHPTLLLWGTSDTTPYMSEGIARLDELMPRAEVRAFEGAPHSLAIENTSELGAAVVEFLTRPEERLPR